jgi:hypothetical protein
VDLKNANFIAFSDFFFFLLGLAVFCQKCCPKMLKCKMCAGIVPGDSETQLWPASVIFKLSWNSGNGDGYFPNVLQNLGILMFVFVCGL